MIWLKILPTLIKTGADVFEKRQETKRLSALAERNYMERVANGEIEYQGKVMDKMDNSWKDEFVLLLVSAPVLLLIWSVFSDDPNIKSKIDLFFEYFGNMPMWFQILFISVVGAVYGIKGADIIKRK
jgi:uncharacterized ion transporter superfamily protein YfcC